MDVSDYQANCRGPHLKEYLNRVVFLEKELLRLYEVERERERDKSGSKHHFAGTLNLCWNYGEAIDRMVKNGLKCCFSCRSFVM